MVNAQLKAIHWLDRNRKSIQDFGDPYEVAVVAYALMLSKAAAAGAAFDALHKRRKYEGKTKLDVLNCGLQWLQYWYVIRGYGF